MRPMTRRWSRLICRLKGHRFSLSVWRHGWPGDLDHADWRCVRCGWTFRDYQQATPGQQLPDIPRLP